MFRHIISFISLAACALLVSPAAEAGKYAYDSVPGDPLHTKAYTLPNGLKIFMTVNRDEPRIQTYIAVRVGGKNDPAETTGLAHYFEHLMFKGTEQFGTQDYAAEKPMLDRIEQLFETYRHTTDSIERKRIYHEIDSVSYYNRKNEMSIFQKRNEQIFSFFASFFLLLFRPLKHQLKADFKPLKQA